MRPRLLMSGIACAVASACASADAAIEFREVPAEALTTPFPGVEFTAIRDIAEAPDAVWVLDTSPPFLTRIEHTGGGALRGGERGEGPEDLLFPIALQVDPDSGLAHVWDLGARAHKVFDATMSLVRSDRLRGADWARRTDFTDVSYADPYRVRLDGRGAVVVDTPANLDVTADFRRASLVRADLALETRREVVAFSDHMRLTRDDPGEFTPVPLWDACGSDLVLWRPASHDLTWLRDDGSIAAQVPIPGRPAPIREADIVLYLEKMIRLELGPNYAEAGIDLEVMARDVRAQFSDELPFVTTVRCQAGGPAWLRVFDNRNDPLGHGRRWLQVTTAGSVDALEFPPSFEPLTATPRGVLGSLESSDGIQRLAEWTR
ncbi:MAG: hypothetical protein F4Z31_14635 [Gemmatimonadetes bacterium]|nr:hypothetical protein [Gemmatimonadota bacterium]MYE93272.1 hypothetical protein [Gemmatimonadota bacterium]MYJ10742.1 hypothetical protein [Gemmatimonadota bacterium]